MAAPLLLTEEDVYSLLDARRDAWRDDRAGWVTLEHCGIAWRVHYRRGEVLEVGWWGTLGRAPARRRGGRVAVDRVDTSRWRSPDGFT
jgi:hypothetical protein